MEALLNSENLAIVALVAWIATLKLDIKYYRELTGKQSAMIDKMTIAIRHIQEVLEISLTDKDSM